MTAEIPTGDWTDERLREVYELARRLRRHRGFQTDDLVQEVCLRLVLIGHKYDPARGPWRNWVKMACRQSACRLARRYRVRASLLGALPHPERVGAPDPRCPDPAAVLVGREAEAGKGSLVACLRDSLAALPDHDREVLTARFGLDGRPPKLLKEVGSSSKEAGRLLVRKSLARLRAEMATRIR